MNALFERFRRSLELFKVSLRVMRDHPKLLLFPLLINLFIVAIALFFLCPVGLAVVAAHWGAAWVGPGRPPGWPLPPAGVPLAVGPLLLAGLYLLSMFLATFCNVAFNSEILRALDGQPVSIRHGVAVACRRFKAILLWSLLAGGVGLLIRAIEQRLSFMGRLVAGFVGLAWSVASIFALPILVRDPTVSNPLTVLRTSARTIKRTWGEALVGYVGMKGADTLFLLLSVGYWIAGVAGAFWLSPWVLLPAGLIWLLAVLVYSYLAGIASKAYLCALYLFAAEGVVPSYYDASMMDAAWQVKGA